MAIFTSAGHSRQILRPCNNVKNCKAKNLSLVIDVAKKVDGLPSTDLYES